MQASFCVGLVPFISVADELARGSLRKVALAVIEPTRYEITAIRRNDISPPSGMATGFLATFREIAELLSMQIESWRTARRWTR